MITLRHILVATDLDDAANNALAYGRELASRFDAILHVIHVVEDPNVQMMAATGLPYEQVSIDDEVDRWRARLEALVTDEDRHDHHVRLALPVGNDVAREIAHYAEECPVDLIVIGTHGRGVLGHFIMGNVAERVVRTAPCPVLTVHAREHEFIRPDALEVVRSV